MNTTPTDVIPQSLTSPCLYCGVPARGSRSFCCQACEALYKMSLQTGPLSQQPRFVRTRERFSFLDQAAFQKRYLVQNKWMYFYVEGLSCSSCVHLLERLPEFEPSVLEARIHFGESTLKVEMEPQGSWAQVAATIEEWGYKVTPLDPHENPQELYKKENRDLLVRVAVAGACAGNMMLFVIPVYAGLEGSWKELFNWLSFALFLPILFYAAKPFYQGAWNFLKYRTVNIDLPIVVAFLSGFFLSTYNLLHHRSEIYFDSTASFLFLILASRYVQKRFQQKYIGVVPYQQIVAPEVRIGDLLTVRQNQIIPVDGTLTSPAAEIDLSLFSGESLPQTFHQNMKVLAGTKVLSAEARIRVEAVGRDTQWGHMLETLRAEALKKSHFVGLTDRLAQKLILFVFSLALGYFIWNVGNDPQAALQRSLALIVIACPCALAFGTPLAYGLALKKARDCGILIKNAAVLEKMLAIQNIFFDKTGTLTSGQLVLVGTEGGDLTRADKEILLSLESQSYHPIAFALRKAWPEIQLYPVLNDLREVLGQGVQGTLGGVNYSLSASQVASAQGDLVVEFKKDAVVSHRLLFRDIAHPDSANVLRELEKNFDIALLSGDKQTQVHSVAQSCGLSAQQCHAELSPTQKKDQLLHHPHSCMVGDGANDALALQAAEVGIAVKGSTALSLESADVYFARGGLSPLLDLIAISKQARFTVRRNLLISFVYNFSGGILALSGFINPMTAALLMPISSILILMSSLRGMR